jgi:hypothetical protein
MSSPVAVPADYIRDAEYDPVQEMISVVDGFLLPGGRTPPPVLGSFLLLELSGNRFFSEPYTCTTEDCGRALFIFNARKKAVPAVVEYIYDRPEALTAAGEKALSAVGEDFIKNYDDFVKFTIETPFNGFAMIPGGGPGKEQFFFNAVSVGRILYLAAKFGNLTTEETLWEVPLATIGHLIACGLDSEGVKGVARPKDPEDIRRQLQAARERQERGESHPWEN